MTSRKGTFKTRCKFGHELSGDNLYLSPQGIRNCKECRRLRSADARKKDPEANRIYQREWMRKQRRENPERLQDYHFRKDYGITIEERNEKIERQKNLCAVCNRIMERPCVDHDHETKQVRDMLCRDCNCALGLLRDDLLVAQSLVRYLQRWRTNDAASE